MKTKRYLIQIILNLEFLLILIDMCFNNLLFELFF